MKKENKLKNPFDLRDLFVFSGLGSTGYGLYMVFPPASYILVGVALFWLGIRRVDTAQDNKDK